MRPLETVRVHLCREAVDFRKAINGLSVLVAEELLLDPFSAHVFGFCNRRRDQVKLLVWERNGFVLWQKRLEKDRFPWPRGGTETVLEVTGRELNWLLDGIDVFRLRPHAALSFSSVRQLQSSLNCVTVRTVGESAELPQDVDTLRAMLAERDTEITQLREYIRLLKSQRFGATSERSHRSQLGLFNEAEALAAAEREAAAQPGVAVAAHTRTPRGRRPLPAWMPREEILHDLPEAEKVCPHDGAALVAIGRESTEQLEFVPATARVLVHVRPKYGCPTCKTGVHTAPLPPQPIPKSLASPSLLAYVAVSKYADALPLYRQEQILGRLGIELSRATLAMWMVRCGELVQPLVNRMREEILASGFVQCDESRFQVLKEPGKPAESLSYVWVQRGGPPAHPLLLYEYDPSRSAEVPKRPTAGSPRDLS